MNLVGSLNLELTESNRIYNHLGHKKNRKEGDHTIDQGG